VIKLPNHYFLIKLLNEVGRATKGKILKANIELLKNNARLGARLAILCCENLNKF
jgi:pseudouridine-5'-phosphate glycosidase